jgi:alginate O-acetyltransferase complex protein AlgI
VIYSNPEFLVLFSATLLSYLAFPQPRIRFAVLFSSSLVFCLWASVFDTAIFAFVVLLSWASAAAAHHWKRHHDRALKVGIALVIGHLFAWKYLPWVLEQIHAWRSGGNLGESRALALPLPLGISFYSLQAVAYLFDFLHGETSYIPLRRYSLFKIFFPQLIAGPIVRAKQFVPQLEALRTPWAEDLLKGATLFTLGFFKKMLLADPSGAFADRIFESPAAMSRPLLILGLLGYSVQIWGDFSGYTDMGRGVARMLGITLPENFLSPYFSQSPREFWRRWHITLSQWIRDYLYLPMVNAKSLLFTRKSSLPRIVVASAVAMLVSGFWHGANWTFVLWGIYHGALLIGERICAESFLNRGFQKFCPSKAQPVVLGLLTYALVLVGWSFFRCPSLEAIGTYWETLLWNPGSTSSIDGMMIRNFAFPFLSMVFVHAVTYPQWDLSTRAKKFLEGRGWKPAIVGLGVGCALAALMIAVLYFRPRAESARFIYFEF